MGSVKEVYVAAHKYAEYVGGDLGNCFEVLARKYKVAKNSDYYDIVQHIMSGNKDIYYKISLSSCLDNDLVVIYMDELIKLA